MTLNADNSYVEGNSIIVPFSFTYQDQNVVQEFVHEKPNCKKTIVEHTTYPSKWICEDCRTMWVQCKVCEKIQFRLRCDTRAEQLQLYDAVYQHCFVCKDCRK